MNAHRNLILSLAQFCLDCQRTDNTDFLAELKRLYLKHNNGGSDYETRNNGRVLHVDFAANVSDRVHVPGGSRLARRNSGRQQNLHAKKG